MKKAETPEPRSDGDTVAGHANSRLRRDELDELHRAAISAGLTDPMMRKALLAGLPPALIANLRVTDQPSGQLLLDLDGLSEALIDGSVPLVSWLRKACVLTNNHRPELAVFTRILARYGGHHPSPPPPTLASDALGVIWISLANLADKDAVAQARLMGDGGSLDVVTASDVTLTVLGVSEGAMIRVIDTQSLKWKRARIMRSNRFHLVGLSRPLREHFGLTLDPKPAPGQAPLRGLTLKLSPFEHDIALSFEAADRPEAQQIAHVLEERGARVYVAPESAPGAVEWCAVLQRPAPSPSAWPPTPPFPAIPEGVFTRDQRFLVPVALGPRSAGDSRDAAGEHRAEKIALELLERLKKQK